jgi:hypothetical protein
MDVVERSDLEEKIEKTDRYCAEQNVAVAIESAKLAHALLDEIITEIKPGKRESEIKQFALDLFAARGIERTWHPPYVRFGDHTLLTFQQRATDDYMLEQTDIAFVDIGIVHGGIEGDAGRTVTFGNQAEYSRLAIASKTIFDTATDFWQNENPSGIALYEFIYAQAAVHGLVWNLDPAGHLIGAFPHRGWKRGINHFPKEVASGKWILEIQLRHPELSVGAFFEDLLYTRESSR